MITFADRVKESALVSGTGSYAFAGPSAGFQGFVAAIGDGGACMYVAELGGSWEVGEGIVDAGAGTLSRERILSSSNAGSAVVWPSASTVTMAVVMPSELVNRVADMGPVISSSGTLAIHEGTVRWYPPRALSFSRWQAWVGTAPTGANLQFTLNKNEIAVTSGAILAGSSTMAITSLTLSLTPSDFLTLSITQVGASVAGADLAVRIMP